MRIKETVALKKMLLSQRAAILNQLTGPQAETAAPTEGADEVEVVVNEQNLAILMHLQERERQFLREIDHTLAKFEDESIGICESCETRINVKRLLARPIARYCVSCQEDQEDQCRSYA